ncbi:Reticulocyte-binding protein 2-like protein a [Larimichthys crocea]|uniref:Uncharacterized protein n=1 Tax=Larimichthys crocea TaxID=215358 RepID=A0ACD3QJQ1_LARCR|nr:Reticulocyte-binding protein 2-like protein a [Larimichthys crocea]
MGDEDRCMEAEQQGEKMVLHCPPVHPLPEEIKKMARSETVCRYCGVSYLIFHEFHQLNTRVAQLEAELQELRETAQREKAWREALELGRLEWERALRMEVQRQAEEKEKSTREELEERSKDTERALREEFEEKNERKRSEMKEEYQRIGEEKERQLRREMGDLEAERLTKQREELERSAEEREKVLSDALQKANKNLDELRKYLQQLEQRLAVAAFTKEEAEQFLGKEKQQGEILSPSRLRLTFIFDHLKPQTLNMKNNNHSNPAELSETVTSLKHARPSRVHDTGLCLFVQMSAADSYSFDLKVMDRDYLRVWEFYLQCFGKEDRGLSVKLSAERGAGAFQCGFSENERGKRAPNSAADGAKETERGGAERAQRRTTQVKRGVGGETGEVVVMPTKARHRTGAAVVMAAERGTNEKEVLRS